MSRIFWDTNLFIYLIEEFGNLSERVIKLRKRMVERGDELYTSALTLGEILIKPMEAGDEALARRYESALLRGAVVIPFDVEPARLYAAIRKDVPSVPRTRSNSLARRMRGWICLSLTMSGSAPNPFLKSSSSAHCSAHSCECDHRNHCRQTLIKRFCGPTFSILRRMAIRPSARVFLRISSQLAGSPRI